MKGIREYRVIEQVGHDILELEANALPDLDVFHDTKVHVPIRQTAEHANASGVGVQAKNRRTKRGQCCVGVGKQVEPVSASVTAGVGVE